MRRALLIVAGIAVLTWLQFEFVPGHTYLQSETQEYVPILEKLDSPGLLSRDLVATHPNVTYTIYDEVTLFVHEVFRLKIQTVLVAQQVIFHFAGLLGIFLLVKSAGLNDSLALVIAAVVNLGCFLSGPDIWLIDPEPTPRAFAFGLVLLATGLFAEARPLMAGLAGGLSLVYDARVAWPLWLAVLVIFFADRSLRALLRPSLTVLTVFVLLLANLAQLQPAAGDTHTLFETLAPPIAQIEQYRTSYVWVSTWVVREFWKYLAIAIFGVVAARYVWPVWNRQTRWLLVALTLIGVLSVPASYLLLERARWFLIPQIQPAQTLAFVAVFASVSCAVAGISAAKARRWLHAVSFLAVVFAVLVGTLWHRASAGEAGILPVALWAERNTWGGSMFLFPDAGRELYPGIFRAQSTRAVWVDWETGKQADYFDSFADEWSRRWQDTMEGRYSEQRLQKLLSLPIDYYVLRRAHALSGAKPVFSTEALVVYEAQALRSVLPPSAASARRGD